RRQALEAYAASKGRLPSDLTVQLEFVDQELKTSEARAGNRLRQATSAREAAEAFMGYERPAGWTPENPRGGHGWKNRANASIRALAQHGGLVEAMDLEDAEGVADARFADIPLAERARLLSAAAAREEREARIYEGTLQDYF